MENAESYEEAVKMIEDSGYHMCCGYLVVAGVKHNQGTVFGLGRYKIAHRRSLNVEGGKWFMVQTNFDPTQFPDPEYDDGRRRPAEKKMEALGRDGTNKISLFDDIMHEYPTFLRNNATLYTTVMSPRDDYFYIKIWNYDKF